MITAPKKIPQMTVIALALTMISWSGHTTPQNTVHENAHSSGINVTSVSEKLTEYPLDEIDILDNIGTDGVAIYEFSAPDNTLSVTPRFSSLELSEGAYLEVASTGRKEVHRYDAKEIDAIWKAGRPSFSPVMIQGKNIIVTVVYPSGKTNHTDKAVLTGFLTVDKQREAALSPVDKGARISAACLKNNTGYTSNAASASDAIGRVIIPGEKGHSAGTAWLLGDNNHLMTAHHVIPRAPGATASDTSVWFNFQTDECGDSTEEDPTEKLSNIVKIKADKILDSQSEGSPGIDPDPDDGADWSLFTLNPLEYREAGIKKIFGGLALENRKPVKGELVSIIGHGKFRDNSLKNPPSDSVKRISQHIQSGAGCYIDGESAYTEFMYSITDCWATAGNSGGPVFSKNYNVSGLVHAGGSFSGDGTSRVYAMRLDRIINRLQQAGVTNPTTTVRGGGAPRVVYRDFTPNTSQITAEIENTSVSFLPLVEGRAFEHKVGYSLLKSFARNNYGMEVPVIFRLSQTNACGTSNLATTCNSGAKTILNVSIHQEENLQAIPKNSSVVGWLPVAVHGGWFDNLLFNQMLHYQYTNK